MSNLLPDSVTVSIVDDDPASRDSICAVIRSAGYKTVAFDSSEAFLNGCDLSQSNCLVVDYRLPGLSGLELQARLRQDRVTAPVILISGYADVEIAVKAMQQGAVTLLQKPYQSQELLMAVERAVKLDIERRYRKERAHDARSRLSHLNAKEMEVLTHMLEGKSNKVVAQTLGIGLRTVERRRHDIFSKTNVDSEVKLAELVQLAESKEV